MKFLDIIEEAIQQNCDCDRDGHIDGIAFAQEQIAKKMIESRLGLVDRFRKPINLNRAITEARKRQDE